MPCSCSPSFAAHDGAWNAGERRGVTLLDDYAHHPTELRAAIDSARELSQARVLAAFQPHLYSRTQHLAREVGAALARADAACVTEIYAAREEPLTGVSGKLVVDAVSEVRPGMLLGGRLQLADAARFLARRARAGDVVLTLGAGDIDQLPDLVLEALA